MFSKLKNLYHFFLAWLGSIVYQHPSRELTVIGVTGTKGKTTTAELMRAVLTAAGIKVAMISSAHIAYGDEMTVTPFHNTMPGRMFIQKFLRAAVKRGCTHAVFEVTSQGTTQYRHRFIDFDMAAITCLHPEHIESHGSYEEYRGAKAQFFQDTARLSRKDKKFFFINSDLAGGGDVQYFEEAVRHPTGEGHFGEVVYYNRGNFVRNQLGGDMHKVSPWMQSEFNLENAALVYEMATRLGALGEAVLSLFKTFAGVEGRYEWIEARTKKGSFSIIIDYAHTPGSYEALLKALAAKKSPHLIAVLGSYGQGRDVWKRPEIGRIAGTYATKLYITNESPGDEDPRAIIDQIASGVTDKSKVNIIEDRSEAIRRALMDAREGDIVALIGKAHETDIRIGKRVIPWNEKRITLQLLGTLQ